MSRIPAAILAVALAAQAGCAGGLSKNQSNGMIYGGGAAVFMGSVVAIDGLICDDRAGGDQACEDDKSELISGAAMIGVGVALGVIGYLLRPQPEKEAATVTKVSGDAEPAPVTGK